MKGSAYHGWNHALPNKFFPVTIDNFFENPDKIRELGLRIMESYKYKSEDVDKLKGRWPGHRSDWLWKADEELSTMILHRIMSLYYNLDFEKVQWENYKIQFQVMPPFSKDKNNVKNKGWIHRDGPDPRDPRSIDPKEYEHVTQLAGLIYLTPDIDIDTGTSLYSMKKDKTLKDWLDNVEVRHKIYAGNNLPSDEEIEIAWNKHRSCFIEKIKFSNIYNRLIMYDAHEFHAVNNYHTLEDKDDRLTLVYFIGGIRSNKWPLERIRSTYIPGDKPF